ncbi:hypothetical protein TEQG_00658 [Trichophyton equinum CBS 127.97]|uniref:Uncharacterized protein n=1 Tax=Trichophyton equinum (strain ATCC MYA-4606 / CBS 127.97) TaxID=559882 RepID=F2PI50_TRIEC|nr:hypothetical protein TEQG_00658 [Trichophyton equinum CBS 127.97]
MAATTTTPTRPRHRQHKLHNYTSQNVPIQAGPSEMDHGSCMVDGGQGKQAPSSCLANRSTRVRVGGTRLSYVNIDGQHVKDQEAKDILPYIPTYAIIHIPILRTNDIYYWRMSTHRRDGRDGYSFATVGWRHYSLLLSSLSGVVTTIDIYAYY